MKQRESRHESRQAVCTTQQSRTYRAMHASRRREREKQKTVIRTGKFGKHHTTCAASQRVQMPHDTYTTHNNSSAWLDSFHEMPFQFEESTTEGVGHRFLEPKTKLVPNDTAVHPPTTEWCNAFFQALVS